MRRNLWLLLHACPLAMVGLGGEPARAQPDPASAEAPAAPNADYKIAFWYRRSDPLGTFRFQAYDLRRGQYTPAVDRWLRTVQADHPDFVAYLKDFRLDPDSRDAERKQVATMILRENLAKGGPGSGNGLRDSYGIYGGTGLDRLPSLGGGPSTPRPMRAPGLSDYSRGYGFVHSPGAARTPGFLASPDRSSPGIPGPFPFPFVRPHP